MIPSTRLKVPLPPIKSVGVDVVSLARVRTFWMRHHDRLGKILTPVEEKFLQHKAEPWRGLARLFSAKEAVFKSLNLPWFGIDGFRMIEVSLGSCLTLPAQAKLSGILKKQVKGRLSRWSVQFIELKEHVIALVVAG